MSARMVRPAHLGGGTLFAIALLCLSGAACFRTVDVSKLHCINNNGCPIGNYYCANGRCIAGQTPVDGSNADLPPSGLGGHAGIDGTQSKGGAGGSLLDGALGGAGGGAIDGLLGTGGGIADSSLGGTGGGVADGPPGGSGGIVADGPLGGVGGATSGTGGTGPKDAPVGTGGTTSVPDAPISPDGRDAPADLPNGLNLGSACSSATASQCSSGACVDGHCCGAASCGTCQSCTGPGGTCVAITNAEDPDSCTGTSSCDTSGACKKKIGQACSAGTDCMGGNCADGVCCNSACSGSCEYCNGGTPGTCSYVSGTPKQGHPACAGTGACQGTCNATKASCTLPGAETTCRQPSCGGTPPTATNQAVCDGNGSCPNLSTTSCSPSICGATSCLTSCSSSSQCASGAACIGGACQPCASGQLVCGNACVNTSSDPSHCGNCTTSCSGGTTHCLNGSCVQCTALSDCPSGYVACSASHTCVCRQNSSTNLLQNPGFDGSLSGWTANGSAAYGSADADGCPGSGSVTIGGLLDAILQCVSINQNTPYSFGVAYLGPANCYTNYFVGTGCIGAQQIGNGPSISDFSGSTTTWARKVGTDVTPASTGSIQIDCSGPTASVSYDQMFLSTSASQF